MQNQSGKLGSSSSPLVNDAIQNSKWNPAEQQTNAQGPLAQKHTDHPVKK